MWEEMDNNFGFRFVWKIDNFYLCPLMSQIRSPDFIVENLNRSKWHLLLNPKGHEKFFCLNLCRNKDDSTPQYVDIDVKTEMIVQDKRIAWHNQSTLPFSRFDVIGLGNLIKISELDDIMKDFPKDPLIIKIYMMVEAARKWVECVAHTRFNIGRSSFKMPITNLNLSNILENKMFYFCADKFQFEINITSYHSKDDLEIIILKRNMEKKEFSCLCARIILLDDDGFGGRSKIDKHRYDSDNVWKFPPFLTKSLLIANIDKDQKRKSTPTLLCDFYIPDERMSTDMEYNYSDSETFSSCADSSLLVLKDNFREMLTNNVQTDVKIKIGEKIFPSHRFVLSARSPVFCAMFEKDMVERNSGIVEISDLDAKTLTTFLLYLYTGELEKLDVENVIQLLLAADKYEVQILKEKCVSLLMSGMTGKNVCEILMIAEMIGHERLKAFSIDFIKNNISLVLSSEEWAQCVASNIQLASEIIVKLAAGLANETINFH